MFKQGDRVCVTEGPREGMHGNIVTEYLETNGCSYDIAFTDGIDGCFYDDELLPVEVVTVEGKAQVNHYGQVLFNGEFAHFLNGFVKEDGDIRITIEMVKWEG